MTDTEAAAAIAILRDAYPRQPFPDAAVAFYARKLQGISGPELVAAVDRLTSRLTFLPSVAEIMRDVAEARLELPDVTEAWEIAASPQLSLRDAPLPVRTAAEFVGGRWAIMHSDNTVATRAQFREQYTRLREQALLEEVGALPQRSLPPARPPQSALEQADDDLAGSVFGGNPVMARAWRELVGLPQEPPTEHEMRLALEIMRPGADPDDTLLRAAELVFVHADQAIKGIR